MQNSFINIFDNGGPVWTTYTNAEYNYTPQKSEAKKEEKKTEKDDDDGLSFKDFAALIEKVDGLPNDKRKMLESVEQLFYFADVYGTGTIDQSHAQQVYLSILSQMGSATQSKEAYKKAADQVEKTGGMYEAVISDSGAVLVMDAKGNQAWMRPEEYAKYKDKVNLVTNNDVLVSRAENDDFAFNDKVLSFVSNGIGIKEVTDLIENSAKNIGTTSTSQEGYIDKQNRIGIDFLKEAYNKAVQMVKEDPSSVPGGLEELMTVDGLYKAKLITKDNYGQIVRSLNYVWKTLPQNAKSLLKTKCEEGTEKEALELVSQLLLSRLTQDYNIEADLEADTDDGTGKKGSPKSDKLADLKNSTLMLLETGNVPRRDITIFAGTSDAFTARFYTAPITKNDKNYGACSLYDMTETDIAALLDFNSIYMGGQRIKNLDMACSTDGKVSLVYLPSTLDENTQAVKPNLEFLGQIEAVKDDLRSRGLLKGHELNVDEKTSESKKKQMIQEVNDAFRNAGLQVYLREDGLVNEYAYKRFAVIQGAAKAEAFDGGEDTADATMHLKKLGSNDQTTAEQITRILGRNASENEKKKYKIDVDSWFGADEAYEGLIFIPVESSFLLSATASGVQIPGSLVNDLYRKENKIKPKRAEYVEAPE